MNKTPPKYPLRFFRWFCHPDYVEDIEGDLLERYEKRPSSWRFTLEVLKLLRPGIIRQLEGTQKLNHYGMVKSNIKIAGRNLIKNKTYVLINMLGMGFALACCLVSFLNLDYKLRFDEYHHEAAEDVYRVNTVRVTENGKEAWGLSPSPLAEAMKSDIPGIHRLARLDVGNGIINTNGKSFSEQVHFADLSLLQMLNFPLASGNPVLLQEKNTVVLDELTSNKYFGYEDPIGQELTLYIGDDEYVFTVGAITKQVPNNTSVIFDVMIPYTVLAEENSTWKDTRQITVFAELEKGIKSDVVNNAITGYSKKHNELNEEFQVEQFYLQPYEDLAFTSDIDLPKWVRGRMLNRNAVGFLVGITTILSLLILLTASFNFTNTSIAYAGSRLKEIGVRKVIGGTRWQLIGQLLTENILLCLASVFVAFIIGFYLIPGYNALFEQTLDLQYIFKTRMLLFLVGFPIIMGLLAGIYPSAKISKYSPVRILKGKANFIKMGWLTKALLVGQFTVSCFAIICAIVLTQNAAYQQHVDFGYDLRNVHVTALHQNSELEEYMHKVHQNPDLTGAAGSLHIVGKSEAITLKEHQEGHELEAQRLEVGVNYLKTIGIDFLQGRPFEGISDNRSIIINQKLAQSLQNNNPIGTDLILFDTPHTIVGIVENHKEFGLTGEEPACVFTLADDMDYRFLSVSGTKPIAEIESYMEQSWYEVNPNEPYNGFAQEMIIYKQLYINTIIRNLCLFLAMVTLIMSAAGFYSIVSLSVQRRIKEIGVRKIFGAKISHMIRLVVSDFTLYILIAFICGTVLATTLIQGFIFGQFYEYHMELGVISFLASFMVMLLVPTLTVGSKVYRAASANPVKALRDE